MPNQTTAKVVVLGTNHPHVYEFAHASRNVANTELVGVYDDDVTRRNKAAVQLGVQGFGSVHEALKTKPALVLIGAEPSQRAELAQTAVKAGAAVLADKPLVLTDQALAELQRTVTTYHKPVMVCYPYRGEPLLVAARQAIEQGQIGKLVRIFASGPHKLNATMRPAWHWTREGNGGALIDIGAHHADLCCWMAGASPVWLCATHTNLSQPNYSEFQDFAQGQMRFSDGTLAHIEVDWLNPVSMKCFGDTRFWFQGTTGKIEIRLVDEKSAYLWNEKVARQPLTPTEVTYETWLQQLVEDLATGRPPSIPQEDVWRASKVALALFSSAESEGRPIALI